VPFKKGDLVYLHDPVYKRGIAKEFSYQYKGPYEIEQKISPLIYKIRMTDGTSTIVHINRLKGASGQAVDSKVHPLSSRSSKIVKSQTRKLVSKGKANTGIRQQDLQFPHHSQILDSVDDSGSGDENEIESTTDPEWTPGASNANRKSQGSDTADGIAYRLRSRLVSRSERETEVDKEHVGETVRLPGSESESTQVNTSPGRSEIVASHSYNLRSKASS
jgi:hypothetical protein